MGERGYYFLGLYVIIFIVTLLGELTTPTAFIVRTNMIKIKLTQRQSAIIDDSDYALVSNHKWFAVLDKKNGVYYARTNIWKNNKKTIMSMHRMILNPPRGLVVHHKNHNGIDNRRANMVVCTKAQNRWHSKKQCKTKNRYKGVTKSYDIKSSKGYGYVAEITYAAKRVHIGFFKNEIDAALAYNEKAKELYGEYAYLNEV